MSVPIEKNHGLMDGLFFGGQRLLEWFFSTLLLRRLQGLVIHNGRDVGLLTPPSAVAPLSWLEWQRHYGCHGGHVVCRATLGHGVLEEHGRRLGLAQRGLLRSHPGTISTYHFSLYRTRHFRLEDVHVGADTFLCDGRVPMCGRHLAPAEVEASERKAVEQSHEFLDVLNRTRPARSACGLV